MEGIERSVQHVQETDSGNVSDDDVELCLGELLDGQSFDRLAGLVGGANDPNKSLYSRNSK